MHVLWHYRLCPHSRAARLALIEAGFAFALQEERPWEGRPEFMALNPAGETPVLVLADGPVLCGTYAITEFVAEEVAMQPVLGRGVTIAPVVLFPGSREYRAEVRRLVDWFLNKVQREVSRDLILETVTGRLIHGPGHQPDLAFVQACRSNLRYHLSYLDFLAYQRHWLAGDVLSFADLAAAAQISCLDYLGEITWSEHPNAKDWYARMKSRPALRPLLAERVPGAPPPLHYTNVDF